MKKIQKKLITLLFLIACAFNLIAQTADYAIDLGQIKAWDDTFTKINPKTNSITFMKAQSGVSITFADAFNATEFNSLEITNKPTAMPYLLMIEYSNGEITKAYVEEQTDRFSIQLKDKAKGSIQKVSIQACLIAGSLRVYSLTFKTEPGYSIVYAPDEPVLDDGAKKALNNDISAIDFVKGIKVGINIGNTFEANGGFGNSMGLKSETYWGNPKVTKQQILMYKNAGYDLIRIPVTWYNHIIDDNYTIDPLWMARVKTVVNWAIEEDLYVILNEHHSVRDKMAKPVRHGEGYRVATEDEAESSAFLKAVWTQIAAAFNNSYDEHLIFETMNEPRNADHAHAWTPNVASGTCTECQKDFELCNKYNQICLDAIRASGGNNAKRFVMIPSLCSDSGAIMNKRFEMPKDSANDKLIATFHNYIMGSGPEWSQSMFTRAHEIQLDDLFIKMEKAFVQNGIPVIMGETGAVKTIAEAERIKWIGFTVPHAREHGIVSVLWEDGGNFKSFDRATGTCFDQAFVDEMTK